jgi:flagellar biosynthetic protein FliR
MLDYSAMLLRIPAFVLVFFRLAGMTLLTPIFGSPRIPWRLRIMIMLVLAMGICPSVKPVALPEKSSDLAVAIVGEIAVGVALGMFMSFVFVGAQWAGELIGQQLGLEMGQVLSPQFGGEGSPIGGLYFWLTTVIFLAVGGHRAVLLGVRDSFDRLPILSLNVGPSLFDLGIGMFQTATILALRLAAPVLATVLAVDLAVGVIGRGVPQFNVLQVGLTARFVLGMAVLIAALMLADRVIEGALRSSVPRFMGLTGGA